MDLAKHKSFPRKSSFVTETSWIEKTGGEGAGQGGGGDALKEVKGKRNSVTSLLGGAARS